MQTTKDNLTSFIIWSHLSPTGEHTCFAGTATVNRSPHQHSSCCWLEASAGSSTKKLAATSGRRHWPICWCCPDRGQGSFDVEDATTLSWSSAAVSEWVQWWQAPSCYCRIAVIATSRPLCTVSELSRGQHCGASSEVEYTWAQRLNDCHRNVCHWWCFYVVTS